LHFEILGRIESIQVIAAGRGIQDLGRLRKQYGRGKWKKLKGTATVRLADRTVRKAEVHWYEAHGIGKKKLKVKRFLD